VSGTESHRECKRRIANHRWSKSIMIP
jgi:hypothetical protein